MILLTVIIPTFNAALTIERCMDSIYSQSFRNFELIVVDGGSSDDTVKIVSKFKGENRMIRIISEKDNGTYDAMNKGITLSQGKWLYFLGGDDWLYNNSVFNDVFILPDSGVYDILYGNVFRIGLKTIYDGLFNEKKLLQKNISHQAIFFNRSVFDSTGFYNTKYVILADWDHNFKWFYDPSVKKKYIDIVIANYSDHGISGTKEDKPFQEDKFLNMYRYAYAYLSTDMKFSILKLILYSFKVRKKYRSAAQFLVTFIGRNIKLIMQRKVLTTSCLFA